MYQLPHNGTHNDFAILFLVLETMVEDLNVRITLNGYQWRPLLAVVMASLLYILMRSIHAGRFFLSTLSLGTPYF